LPLKLLLFPNRKGLLVLLLPILGANLSSRKSDAHP
jgi:hypothetical protein